MIVCHCLRACPAPGLAGGLRRETSFFTNLGFRGRLEAYPSRQRYRIICYLRKKRKKKNRKKRRKEKGLLHKPGGAVCQGFAGENYACRASFSTVKRRSRLTLTGRWRQATFAGVFVFDDSSLLDRFYTISPSLSDLADFFKIQRTVVS